MEKVIPFKSASEFKNFYSRYVYYFIVQTYYGEPVESYPYIDTTTSKLREEVFKAYYHEIKKNLESHNIIVDDSSKKTSTERRDKLMERRDEYFFMLDFFTGSTEIYGFNSILDLAETDGVTKELFFECIPERNLVFEN